MEMHRGEGVAARGSAPIVSFELCDAAIGTRVTSSGVSSDAHEADNLAATTFPSPLLPIPYFQFSAPALPSSSTSSSSTGALPQPQIRDHPHSTPPSPSAQKQFISQAIPGNLGDSVNHSNTQTQTRPNTISPTTTPRPFPSSFQPPLPPQHHQHFHHRNQQQQQTENGVDIAQLVEEARTDASRKSRGFLCTNFVRPPVELTITFDQPVAISLIRIKPTVPLLSLGNNGVHVLALHASPSIPTSSNSSGGYPSTSTSTSTSTRSRGGRGRGRGGREGSRGRNTQGVPAAQVDSRDEGDWKFLGVWDNLHSLANRSGWTTLRNASYRPPVRDKASGYPPPPFNQPDPDTVAHAAPIDRNSFALGNVRRLRLTIKKMLHSSTVGLAGLEIWGTASYQCTPTEERELLKRLWQIHQRRQALTAYWTSQTKHAFHPESEEDDLAARAKRIPNERVPAKFIDPITFDMMLHPVVVPSGKVIDRSTMERHLQNHLTDPFSGLAIARDDIVPDLALRREIEEFVRSFSDAQDRIQEQEVHAQLLPVPSTIAPKPLPLAGLAPAAFAGRGYVLNGGNSQPRPEQDSNSQHKRKQIIEDAEEVIESGRVSEADASVQKRRKDSRAQETPPKAPAIKLQRKSTIEKQPVKPLASDVKYRVEKSSEGNVVLVLQDEDEPAPTLTPPRPAAKHSPLSQLRCALCKRMLNEGQPLLQLPCNHRCCRSCAVTASTPKETATTSIQPGNGSSDSSQSCPVCGTPWTLRQLQRVHVPSLLPLLNAASRPVPQSKPPPGSTA